MKKRITILIAAVVVIAGAIAIKTYIDYRRAQDEMYRKIEKRNREKRKFGLDMRKARSKMKREGNKLKQLQKKIEAGLKKAEKMKVQVMRLEWRNEETRRYIDDFKRYNERENSTFKGFDDLSLRIERIKEKIEELNRTYKIKIEIKNKIIYGIGYAEEKADLDRKQAAKIREEHSKLIKELDELAVQMVNDTQKIKQMEKTIKQYEEWEKLPDEEWDKIADKIKFLPDDDGKDEDEKDDEKDE